MYCIYLGISFIAPFPPIPLSGYGCHKYGSDRIKHRINATNGAPEKCKENKEIYK